MTEQQLDALLIAIDAARIAAESCAYAVCFAAGVSLSRVAVACWRRLI
jgi:hypothetical protein